MCLTRVSTHVQAKSLAVSTWTRDMSKIILRNNQLDSHRFYVYLKCYLVPGAGTALARHAVLMFGLDAIGTVLSNLMIARSFCRFWFTKFGCVTTLTGVYSWWAFASVGCLPSHSPSLTLKSLLLKSKFKCIVIEIEIYWNWN